MDEIKLDVQLREKTGSRHVKGVRREDAIPAVVYGMDKKPTTIKLDRRTYERIRRAHHGEVLFHLNVFNQDKKLRDYSAIVREEQHDPVSDQILHIDFKRISLKEKIEVKVPLVPKGDPVGVKRDGGSLEHVIWELDCVCLPTDIPEEIKIDVNGLEIGDAIHVKDIALPAGVTTEVEEDAVVFTVAPPMKEEEPAEEGEEGEEPEVIGKEKAEEGEDGEETGEAAKEEPKAEEKKEES